jgi:hypothetical protein
MSFLFAFVCADDAFEASWERVAFMVDGHLVSFDTVCKHSRHVVYDDDDAVIE